MMRGIQYQLRIIEMNQKKMISAIKSQILLSSSFFVTVFELNNLKLKFN